MKKILLLGSQHGNELLGELLYKHIETRRRELLPYITYKIANPRAKKVDVRYIESDMNRSYDGGDKTYEQRQAKRILKYIEANDFDLVLDLHTCFSIMPACLIVAPSYNKTISYIRASSLDKMMIVSSEVVKTSLIGNCPNAITIEVNRDCATMVFVDLLCDDLARYIEDSPGITTKTVYKAELLAKDEISPQDANKLVNFVKSKQGFHPVLVGSNPYKKDPNYKYLGFKAYTAERTKI